jgi:hypothetical protein
MKSLKKTSVVLMTALFLTSMFPQEANAGHKKSMDIHGLVVCGQIPVSLFLAL